MLDRFDRRRLVGRRQPRLRHLLLRLRRRLSERGDLGLVGVAAVVPGKAFPDQNMCVVPAVDEIYVGDRPPVSIPLGPHVEEHLSSFEQRPGPTAGPTGPGLFFFRRIDAEGCIDARQEGFTNAWKCCFAANPWNTAGPRCWNPVQR